MTSNLILALIALVGLAAPALAQDHWASQDAQDRLAAGLMLSPATAHALLHVNLERTQRRGGKAMVRRDGRLSTLRQDRLPSPRRNPDHERSKIRTGLTVHASDNRRSGGRRS
jgi:hypothetical protein